MVNLKWILSVVWTLALCRAGNVSNDFKTCTRSDPNVDECIRISTEMALERAANGLKQYRIPSLRPLKVPFMRISVNENLGFNVSNVEINGLDNLSVDKVESNFEKRYFNYSFTVPRLEVIGDYNIAGRILILPINGNGPMNTSFVNHKVSFSYEYDVENRNGQEYMVPKNPTYIITHNDRVYYHLDNLFNGNKLLGDEMNKFLDENWKEVDGEIGARLGDATGLLITGILQGFMSKVPYTKLFLV